MLDERNDNYYWYSAHLVNVMAIVTDFLGDIFISEYVMDPATIVTDIVEVALVLGVCNAPNRHCYLQSRAYCCVLRM